MAGEAGKIVLEGSIWLWEREDEAAPKAWLPRWCVANMAGPGRLRLRIYNSAKHSAIDSQPHEVQMEHFAGVEAFPSTFEGKPYCFSLVTYYRTYCIALASCDVLQAWMECVGKEIGREWTFFVRVLATQNIVPTGDAMMRFYPRFFSLTNGTPPVCLGLWQHNHLRRYGGSQGFSFESGSRSIGGPEVYRLATSQGAAIKDLFDCVAHGRPLPEPPAPSVKRSASGTTTASSTLGEDNSDTWSLASFQTGNNMRPYGTTPSAFAFANDTMSMSSYSTLVDDFNPDGTAPLSANSAGGVSSSSASGSSSGRRQGDYDYVAVDMQRRPTATSERDVNYLSVQLPSGNSGSTSPTQPSDITPSSAQPTGNAPTIYSGVDLQKTAQLRDALVQSSRHTAQ